LLLSVVLNGVRALLGVPVFRRVSDEIFGEKTDGTAKVQSGETS